MAASRPSEASDTSFVLAVANRSAESALVIT
jgi:hypothetical protein